MGPTSLKYLLDDDGVTLTSNGLVVMVRSSWILEGEDRLSYTTLIRLVECCREHHWNKDLLPEAKDEYVDSITKSIIGSFIQPIKVGSVISIQYRIVEVRTRAYRLKFDICDSLTHSLCAIVEIVSVFYDPVIQQVAGPPIRVLDKLSSLLSTS